MRSMILALLLLLPGLAQATPFTFSLAGSSCTWCTDGALTLDQTDHGFVFSGFEQSIQATYLGTNPLFEGMLNYDCLYCNGLSTLSDGTQHNFMDASLVVDLTTHGSIWSLALREVRQDWVGSTRVFDTQYATLTNAVQVESLAVPVPESPTWILLFSGLAVMGWKFYRLSARS